MRNVAQGEGSMTKDEALRVAMDWYGSGNQDPDEFERLILSIVAQPEQDWIGRERAVGYREGHRAALAQRTWVGLTDEEIWEWFRDNTALTNESGIRIVRAIEAKLKEKNT
jgi:hypothetical protein